MTTLQEKCLGGDMKTRHVFFPVLALTLLTTFASAAPLATGIGSPDDIFFGCDSSLKADPSTFCRLTFDESGNISGNISTFLSPTVNRLIIGSGPTASNAAWVDSAGNALQVTSYYVSSDPSDFNGLPLSLIEGTIGLCEFGVESDGSCTGGSLSDVLIFTNSANNTLMPGFNRIDVLSDNEALFSFATDINTLEVGPEGSNGATFSVLNPEGGGGEDIFYTFTSDVPEPSSVVLLGSALLLFAGKLRRRLVK
jgi:hypothetical protein